MTAQGTVSLDREKKRRLFRELEDRARRTVRALRVKAPASAGPTVCGEIDGMAEERMVVYHIEARR